MSTVADIKRAKADFEDHVAKHGCRPAMAVFEKQPELLCTERLDLWFAYQRTAYMWGLEPDDDARQRAHYERNARRAAA